jgi:hypothetical protein
MVGETGVREVEDHLDAMAAHLDRATAWSLARPALAGAMRREILEVTRLLMRSGYSQPMHDADIALTTAITAFVYHQSDASMEIIHERMADYRAAALSSQSHHAPILPLIELALGRQGWDAAMLQATRG